MLAEALRGAGHGHGHGHSTLKVVDASFHEVVEQLEGPGVLALDVVPSHLGHHAIPKRGLLLA
ncbi:MAG: hypothetical protein AAF447_07045 [Myxococcota bacterium]